jgi:sugar lactone lactonase YvrE
MSARICLEAQDIVGESIIWCAAEQALYWVDIGGKRIHRFKPESRHHDVWPTPEFPTSIGLRASGGFIVGLTRDVCLWRPGGAFEPLSTPEPDMPDNRLNEGRVAPDGSFWVGTMQNNLMSDGSPKPMDRSSGALYRIAPDGSVKRLTPRDIGITNTMCWRRDGRFVSADTLKDTLYIYDVDEVGNLVNRQIYAQKLGRGYPDGSCLDSEDHVWNCRVAGGSAVARIAPDGSVNRYIELPCSWPTSCTFGGADLATLYVTSARFTMTAEHLAAVPIEGAMLACEPGVKGCPEPMFAG